MEHQGKCLLIDFTSHRIQKVCVNNTTSENIELYQDMPQFTVLGPHLFNFFVNDKQ